jgi:hypothetical protein
MLGRRQACRRVSRVLRATSQAKARKVMLDPAPRMALDPRFGLASLGRSARNARIVEELYEHTIDVILRAEALERYEALPAQDIFDVEYWDLEQNKLMKGGTPPPFSCEVAWVTGAASGIGKAAVDSLLARGAAVVGPTSTPRKPAPCDDYLGLRCDVSDEGNRCCADARHAFRPDMLLNAGIFAAGRSIRTCRRTSGGDVDQSDANLALLRACHPCLGRRRAVLAWSYSCRRGRPALPRSHSPNSPGSRRSSGARTASASTRSTPTRCSTRASGPRTCLPSARSDTA